jgi:hypothetical protein
MTEEEIDARIAHDLKDLEVLKSLRRAHDELARGEGQPALPIRRDESEEKGMRTLEVALGVLIANLLSYWIAWLVIQDQVKHIKLF